ncbi:MAG: hypothetical protein Q3998_05245 [Porphyromonas sp.]|nr:hypothetical protein [Porphyromonas sp.]
MEKRYIGLAMALLLVASCGKGNKGNESDNTAQEQTIQGDSIETVTEEAPVLSDEYMVAMAVGSDDGKQFILKSDDSNTSALKGYTHSIYKGKSYPIRFVRMKSPHPSDNGRETTHNFYYMSGALFETTGQSIRVEKYDCVYAFLCNDAFVRDFEVLKTGMIEDGGDLQEDLTNLSQKEKDLKKAFENDYKRSVIKFHRYQSIPEKGLQFYAIQFKEDLGRALGVIAIETPEGFATLEEDAEYNESSIWRVDDDGVYYPKYVKECFLKKDDNTLVFLLEDNGAEGVYYSLWTIKGDKVVPFRLPKKLSEQASQGEEETEEEDNEEGISWGFYAAPL